jgi:glycosyltransferase involved in cell wall biosynthesis
VAIADIDDKGVAGPGGVVVPDLGGGAPGDITVADNGVAAPGGVVVPDADVARPGGATPGSVSPRVSVVIPALNEARNLPYVFAQLPKDLHEVILVDGHSTDDTVAVARALYDAVRVVYQTRRGKGNALHCGFAASTGDIIVMLDADGSTSTAEIPRFVAALRDGADFAKGSRFAPGGGSVDITAIRRLGNWGLTGLVNVLFGTQYTDLCYGYNAFWRRCLPAIHVDCDGFEVETLVNIRAAQAGLRIAEVPSMEGDRIFGESNLNAWRDGRRILKTILTERFSWRGARRAKPYLHAVPAQALLPQPNVHVELAQERVTA